MAIFGLFKKARIAEISAWISTAWIARNALPLC
jgi:hypothetical protein